MGVVPRGKTGEGDDGEASAAQTASFVASERPHTKRAKRAERPPVKSKEWILKKKERRRRQLGEEYVAVEIIISFFFFHSLNFLRLLCPQRRPPRHQVHWQKTPGTILNVTVFWPLFIHQKQCIFLLAQFLFVEKFSITMLPAWRYKLFEKQNH